MEAFDAGSSSTRFEPPIRSVVFDLDGLLIDSEPIFLEVGRQVLARRNKPLTAELIQAMMGSPARQALQVFRDYHQLGDSVETLTVECWEAFFAIWEARPAPLLPGVLPLLDRLERAGLPKAIATSSRASYVQRVLAPFGLLPRFDFVLSADDVQLGKPDPEIYQLAAARCGHPAIEMLVLEDSVNGLRAAKAAGARCVVVPHELVARHALGLADAVVDSLHSPVLHRLLGL